MEKPACWNCIYWHGRPVDDMGYCRRHAPRSRVPFKADTPIAVWPPVDAQEWCGDHRRDPDAAEAAEAA